METTDRRHTFIRAWRARLKRAQDELKKREAEAHVQARACAQRLVAIESLHEIITTTQ